MVDPIMQWLCVILLTTGVVALAVAFAEYCVRPEPVEASSASGKPLQTIENCL